MTEITDKPDIHFYLKKFHSLLGMVPVGLFLLEHLFTNAFAMLGQAAWQERVDFLMSLPLLVPIEFTFIWAPIALHAAYGIFITLKGEYIGSSDVIRQGYLANWLYLLQRISGIVALVFITMHMWDLRFGAGHHDMWSRMTEIAQRPQLFWLYVVGITSVTFHFANGVRTFLISWGITISLRAQRIGLTVSACIFLSLTVLGVASLTAFAP